MPEKRRGLELMTSVFQFWLGTPTADRRRNPVGGGTGRMRRDRQIKVERLR
jgi:hypothetical protein